MTSWIDASTKIICLFGNPVDHSLSPLMHNAAFEHLNLNFVYIAHRVFNVKSAIEAARNLGYIGFNVTVPHKISALPAVDILDQSAQATGALNTGYWQADKLHGTNTDTIGAKNLLLPFKKNIQDQRILVIGAGGGARAIISALTQMIPSTPINLANRTIEHVHKLMEQFPETKINPYFLSEIDTLASKSSLIINTTSVGRKSDTSIISPSTMNSSQIIFDINYRIGDTKLIRDAKKIGCQIIDGLDLLVAQGAASFELWTGTNAPVDIMTRVLEERVK